MTCVLLDPKLLDQLILGVSSSSYASASDSVNTVIYAHDEGDVAVTGDVGQNCHPQLHKKPKLPPLLNHRQCRRLMADIASCSLMRLDPGSMDKLWDLTVMLLKWQITLLAHGDGGGNSISSSTQPLLDLTFRHMDGIARLLPDQRKTTLVDCTKRHLIEFWDQMSEPERLCLLDTMQLWLRPFAVKISLLMRLGFQRPDAKFETHVDSAFFRYYADHVGENVYTKHAYVTTVSRGGRKCAARHRLRVNGGAADEADDEALRSREIDALAAQLSVATTTTAAAVVADEVAQSSPLRHTMSSSRKSERQQRPNDDGAAVAHKTTVFKTMSSATASSSSSNNHDNNHHSSADDPSPSGSDVFGGDNGIMDEVIFNLDAYNRKRRADLRAAGETIITIDSRDSEFEHVQRTCSSLDAIIDRFSLDFFRPMGDVGIIEELDCTRELLRLLDEG